MVQLQVSSGSIRRFLKSQWQLNKELRIANFGATTTILPLIPPQVAISATTHTTWPAASGSSQTATWSTAPSVLTTPYTEDLITTLGTWTTPGLYGPAGIPNIKFAGGERLTIPDAAYWTRATSAVSWVFCVVLPAAGAADQVIWSKWDATAGAQNEWLLMQAATTGKLSLLLKDQSAGITVQRVEDVASATLRPLHIAVTHDGGTGATACDNTVIYVNGAVVASTATNNGSYAGMDDGTAAVVFARDADTAAVAYLGNAFGGPFGPTFVQAQATAGQVLRDYEMFREALGLGR